MITMCTGIGEWSWSEPLAACPQVMLKSNDPVTFALLLDCAWKTTLIVAPGLIWIGSAGNVEGARLMPVVLFVIVIAVIQIVFVGSGLYTVAGTL